MATVVLNIAIELSVEYEKKNIELSLRGIIKTKSDLTMKYARDTNDTGSGFVDILSCPTSITMDGPSAAPATFSTTLSYGTGQIFCQWIYDGSQLKLSFNLDISDLAFADYLWYQIVLNALNQSGVFPDGTTFSAAASYPLLPDGVDDNFDSDNYTAYSTGTIGYSSGYSDNDDDARKLMYGYIIENSGLYNIFWSNSWMKQYIAQNIWNNHPYFVKIGDSSATHLYLDIDSSFRLILYRIDKNQYDLTKEMIPTSTIYGTWEIASIGYLQSDLSLSPTKTGTWEYVFDFINHDYALFVENTATGSLLYRIRAEQASTNSGVYINPLKDQDPSIFSYLWSHLLIDEEGKLIGDQFELFGLK